MPSTRPLPETRETQLRPVRVAGGFRLAWHTWVRLENGDWDGDYSFAGSEVYATEADAEAAKAGLRQEAA